MPGSIVIWRIAAEALRIASETGSNEAGEAAGPIAANGDPLRDIKALKHPALVVKELCFRLRCK